MADERAGFSISTALTSVTVAFAGLGALFALVRDIEESVDKHLERLESRANRHDERLREMERSYWTRDEHEHAYAIERQQRQRETDKVQARVMRNELRLDANDDRMRQLLFGQIAERTFSCPQPPTGR